MNAKKYTPSQINELFDRILDAKTSVLQKEETCTVSFSEDKSGLTGIDADETIQSNSDYFSVDARDQLHKIKNRSTMELKNGFACFPKDDPLNECVRNVSEIEGYFDVAMHGTPTAVCFGTRKANMSPKMLASIIRHSKNYVGQNVRLLSCSTGQTSNGEYCFAEELANALGVNVTAPNDELYISTNSSLRIGKFGGGQMVEYKPNQRGRFR